MSITGHRTEAEVIRYTKKAQNKVLADHAMDALQQGSKKRKSANRARKVSTTKG